LLLIAVLLYGLIHIRIASHAAAAIDAEGREGRRELGLNIGVTLGWLVVAACTIALLTGDIALAGFVAKQVVWTLVVVAVLCLLRQRWDRLLTTALSADSHAGRALGAHCGLGSHRLNQAAVLLSAALRVIL